MGNRALVASKNGQMVEKQMVDTGRIFLVLAFVLVTGDIYYGVEASTASNPSVCGFHYPPIFNPHLEAGLWNKTMVESVQ